MTTLWRPNYQTHIRVEKVSMFTPEQSKLHMWAGPAGYSYRSYILKLMCIFLISLFTFYIHQNLWNLFSLNKNRSLDQSREEGLCFVSTATHQAMQNSY